LATLENLFIAVLLVQLHSLHKAARYLFLYFC